MGAHENLARDEKVELGSDRSFGLAFGAIFAALGTWQIWHDNRLGYWLLGFAVGFLLLSLLAPRLLRPVNHLWFRFGLLLNRITSPIFMGLLFYGVITAVAWLMRLIGKRPLKLDPNPSAETYWVPRSAPALRPDSFKDQF